MDLRSQDKPTDENREKFYPDLYPVLLDTQEELVDLRPIVGTAILVDSCGWYYQKFFPDADICSIEPLLTAHQFKLNSDQYDRLIDNQKDNARLVWPSINCIADTVVFDRSPLLKYRTIEQIAELVSDMAKKYLPNRIILRSSLVFINDTRLCDRFYNFYKLRIANYVVEKFDYDSKHMIYQMELRCQKK